MFAIVRPEHSYTRKERAKMAEHSGRKSGQTAGTYLDNLVQLRKVIFLSPQAVIKFDHKKHKYQVDKRLGIVFSECDATRERTRCYCLRPMEMN
jgi:hypothetical protein